MPWKRIITVSVLLVLALFLTWRFLRPMNIFVVTEAFERPISTMVIPAPLKTLRAKECGECHPDFYAEWSTAIHSQAWTDPYFQVDWKFDRSQQICKNCHTPLDRQQEGLVLGFRDRAKWDPILASNPDFDRELQHEGVTCAVCHLREGKILGPFGGANAPHPVTKIENSNEICMRCHVVGGNRWDTFFRFPPCGTAAEILAIRNDGPVVRTGEIAVRDIPALRCVECHMPLVERPMAVGGEVRSVRRHLWRGGHDPEMVKQALSVAVREEPGSSPEKRRFTATLTNVGAAHYFPTGTPDRHLTVHFRLRDAEGKVIKEKRRLLKRTILWRPFIVELWDTRLPYNQPRTLRFDASIGKRRQPETLEVTVRYHLLDEARRKRIGYENREPISYEIYRTIVRLTNQEPGLSSGLSRRSGPPSGQ